MDRKAHPADPSEQVALILELLEDFKEELRDLRDHQADGALEGATEAWILSIALVCDFVEGIEGVHEERLTAPLRALQAALGELQHGHTHPGLTARKIPNRKLTPETEQYRMALAALAVDWALRSGEGLTQATASVARALQAQGHTLTPTGKPITATTVRNWRAELMGGPGKYDLAVAAYRARLSHLPAEGHAARGGWKPLIEEMLPRIIAARQYDLKKPPT